MSEENKVTELSEEIRNKMKLRKEMKEITQSEWTIPQEVLQDIQAEDSISTTVHGGKKPSLISQIERMKNKIEEDYKEQPDLKKTILDSIPHYQNMWKWTKSDTWEKAVMNRIKTHHIFNNENKSKVLDAILKAAISSPGSGGSLKAAELYFKLEGSLNPAKDAAEAKDAVYEKYRNLQQTLHKKK